MSMLKTAGRLVGYGAAAGMGLGMVGGAVSGAFSRDDSMVGGAGRGAVSGAFGGAGLAAAALGGAALYFGRGRGLGAAARRATADVVGRSGGYVRNAAEAAGGAARSAAGSVANSAVGGYARRAAGATGEAGKRAYAGAARTVDNYATTARGGARTGRGRVGTPVTHPRMLGAHFNPASGPTLGSNRRKAIPMGPGTVRGTGVTQMPSNQGISQLKRLTHRKQALGALDRLAKMNAPKGGLESNSAPINFHPGRAQLRRLTKKMNSNTAVQPVRPGDYNLDIPPASRVSSVRGRRGQSMSDSLLTDSYGYGYLQNVRKRR